ncbi:cytochrome c family protein [Citromicrobium bathyomarinum]|jgi:cytochrome c|uniref:c-type cytochrome n=1 Tax=Citromicrobium TaxID=72173 RepID=UPI000225E072|nr:cytochrome c family protein [Citromicrobium sp. JLT1363]
MKDDRNTAFGWILFSGIIALGATSISSHYFGADDPESPEEPGYFIEGGGEEGGEDSGPPLANLLAAGSASAGEGVFAKCTACHTINQGGANGIGPNLYGVMGTGIGQHAAGFAYSSALSGHGGEWNFENMDAWLASPRAFASGTKMSFAGLSNPEDRANVILYLLENGGGPPLPEPVAEGEETEEGAEGADSDFPGEGPGAVEGAEAGEPESAGAMSDDQPVPEQVSATVSED